MFQFSQNDPYVFHKILDEDILNEDTSSRLIIALVFILYSTSKAFHAVTHCGNMIVAFYWKATEFRLVL